MTDYKYIGERLKEYFGNIGLTQSEIAAKLGVSQQAVGAYLNGQPFGKKVAQKWSDLFKIQYNWLLTGEGAMLKESVPIPEETIAAALGHGKKDVTDIYISFDQNKIDEANRRVIDYLNKN